MIRYTYVRQLQPPAPFVKLTLQNPATGAEVRDVTDRTGEFIEMLHSIARVQPSCQTIVEAFERVSTGSA